MQIERYKLQIKKHFNNNNFKLHFYQKVIIAKGIFKLIKLPEIVGKFK